VVGDKSTLQLAVDRLVPDFSWNDIYVATSQQYTKLISAQLANLPPANIIGEPEVRDVGPAVGLVTAILHKKFPHVPVLILWSDHLVKEVSLFKKIIRISEKIIRNNKNKIIFISQKPRFASQNLGWIKFGSKIKEEEGISFYSFEQFHYRPTLEVASSFHKSGHHAWNLGYFVTTVDFLWNMYQKYQPEIFKGLEEIKDSVNTEKFLSTLKRVYPKMPKISFDNAILEKIESSNALVVSEDLGWSDVGTWEALKEALQTKPDQNVVQGKVLLTDCQDTLVYNYTDKLVVAIDLNGMLVINTHDVALICHKNSVPKIKKMVEKLADSENNHLI